MKFVLISIIFLLAGCTTIYSRDQGISNNPSLLEPQTKIKFSDLPVPGGFKLLAQESYSFEAGGVRVGLLKYQGKADVDQVINFYKEQMAMYNWELLNVVEFGQRLMNFDRESESCIISLSPKGKNITITISVGPKTQRAAQRNKSLK
jgi:hypothetical protein